MRNYILYSVIIFLVLFMSFMEPYSTQYFIFDRTLINEGEWWRLFTAHFLHLSNTHMIGNLLAVCLFAYIAGEYLNNLQGILLVAWCIAVVGLGLYMFANHLERYVGLSGVLHGLLIASPFISKFYSRTIAYCFLTVIIVKVGWEQSPFYDDMALVDTIGGRVEAKSHLMGVVAGLSYLFMWCTFRNSNKVKTIKEKGESCE